MPLIRLEVRDESPVGCFPASFLDEKGAVQRIPRLRLRTTILVGPDPAPGAIDPRPSFPALIDTGAWISVFPRHVWAALPEATYHRLALNPEELARHPESDQTPRSIAGGTTYPTSSPESRLARSTCGADGCLPPT